MYIAFEIKISDVHCFGNQNSDGQYYGNQNSYTMLWSKGSDVHCYGNQSFSVHCCVSKDHNIAIETKALMCIPIEKSRAFISTLSSDVHCFGNQNIDVHCYVKQIPDVHAYRKKRSYVH